MPSHLHPRSRTTTSLFATTLLFSFLVVGMPHIFPCPAPRMAFADNDYPQHRRRRRPQHPKREGVGSVGMADGERQELSWVREADDDDEVIEDKRDYRRRKAHECPVPKPRVGIGGIQGMLGWKGEKKEETERGDRSEG